MRDRRDTAERLTVPPKSAVRAWGGIVGGEEHSPTSAKNGQIWGTVLEVAVAYALLECALWTLGRTQFLWALATAVWVTYCTVRSRQSAKSAGVAVRHFWRGWWVVGAALAVAVVMLLAGWVAGSAHELQRARAPLWHAVLYGLWALVQQFLTQSFIFTRLERVAGGRRAVLITGLLFGFAHIPNPVLTVATLAAGLMFSEVFRRYRNLYPLAIAHAVLGLALAMALPESATGRMRVGIAWWK